jgi:glycosyltransferase involved in cell wall biosynthesis
MNELVIVCGNLQAGGAERVISVLSNYLPIKFPKITIFTWLSAPIFYEIDSRVKVVCLEDVTHSCHFVNKAIWLRKYVRERKGNIIVLSFMSLFCMKTLVSLLGIKAVKIVAERNDPQFVKGGVFIKMVRNILYLGADGILCQTDTVRSFYRGALLDKCSVIFNPLSVTRSNLGKAIDYQKNNKIVSVGRLERQKRYDLLIKAFALFHQAKPFYTLTIYGEGREKKMLENLISDLDLQNYVFLPGKVQNVHESILDANAFVMTSLYEGMSNSLTEAMALGLPCISTRVSGANELIQHGVNGLLSDSTPEDISRNLLLLVDNPEYLRQLAKNAVEVSKMLDPQNIANQWAEYLCKFA